MNKIYNYRKALKEDILNYIKDNDVLDYKYESAHELHEILNDELWGSNIVGNDGDYYASAEKCEEYLAGNLSLGLNAVKDLGADFENIPVDPKETIQYLDCMIRLHLLWDCIWDALKELGFKEDYE